MTAPDDSAFPKAKPVFKVQNYMSLGHKLQQVLTRSSMDAGNDASDWESVNISLGKLTLIWMIIF